MLRVVVLLAAVLAVRGQSTTASRCTNHGGELPLNVYVAGCTEPPCLLPQLQNAVINIVFRAPRNLNNMQTRATAYLLFIPIQYDLGDNAVTCNFLTNTFCPVMEGEVVTYTLNMFIESFMPVGTQVPVEFRIQDESGTPFLCIRMPIRIVEPIQNRLAGNYTLPAL